MIAMQIVANWRLNIYIHKIVFKDPLNYAYNPFFILSALHMFLKLS